MNIAIKHMFRNKYQKEGRNPPQPYYPPGPEGWEEDILPGFAYTGRESHEQRLNRFVPPAYDYNAPQELPTSYQEAPDPLKQSDFYANGAKIRPWAHVRVPSYLAIAEIEAVSDDEFKSGKLSSEGSHYIPQHALTQLPIDITPLIPEADFTTFGATNELNPDYYHSNEDGHLYA
jgi:hypothetical protein